MVWLEIVGWAGSLLVIVSLTQARVLRFRWLNLAGAVIATVYNTIVGIWPFAVMNGVIAVIDVYWLFRLHRERHDAQVYGVLEVPADDSVLRHLLDTHAPDIARFHPAFGPALTRLLTQIDRYGPVPPSANLSGGRLPRRDRCCKPRVETSGRGARSDGRGMALPKMCLAQRRRRM